jgi:hypothetical protein
VDRRGSGFLRMLRFSLPILIPLVAPHSPSSIIWGWYSRSIVAAVPRVLGLTPLKIRKNKYKIEQSLEIRTENITNTSPELYR